MTIKMKKIIILFALCVAFVMALVARNKSKTRDLNISALAFGEFGLVTIQKNKTRAAF